MTKSTGLKIELWGTPTRTGSYDEVVLLKQPFEIYHIGSFQEDPQS